MSYPSEAKAKAKGRSLCRTWLFAGNPLSRQRPSISLNTFSTGNSVGELGNQQGSSNNQNDTENKKYWVAGFIEGEGSFNISFKLNAELRMGVQVAPELSVTQHKTGKQSLELVKEVLLSAGNNIKPKSGSPDVLVYTVTNVEELNNIVVPFLKKYNSYSARKAAFALGRLSLL